MKVRILALLLCIIGSYSALHSQTTQLKISKTGTDTSLDKLHSSIIIPFIKEVNDKLATGHYIVGQPKLNVYRQGIFYLAVVTTTLTPSSTTYHTKIARRGSWWVSTDADIKIDGLIAQQKELSRENCNIDTVVAAADLGDKQKLVAKEIFYKYY